MNAGEFVTIGTPAIEEKTATNLTETSGTLTAKITSLGGVSYWTTSALDANMYNGLKLWLKADEGADGGTWLDHSGNGNHAVKQGSPTLTAGALNGLPVMRYSGANGEYHSFTNMTDVRTIFWVLKATDGGGFSSLLGDNNLYHFHPDNNRFWSNNNTNVNVNNGTFWQNGVNKIGQNENKPSAYAVLSLRTAGNVEASNFYNDRNINGRTFKGDLAELLIYNTALTDSEIHDIEGKLAWKWGLQDDLATGHPHESANPNLLKVNLGGEQATVTFHWGDDNGSANGNAWDNSQELVGKHDLGMVEYDLTTLTKGSYLLLCRQSIQHRRGSLDSRREASPRRIASLAKTRYRGLCYGSMHPT